MDKIDCPYCDGKGHNRAFPQKKCIKCGGKGYRVRNPHNGVVIAQSGTPAVLTPDAPQTPELAPLAALSDTDLKARYDAAWALVLAYGEEIRRRAGEAVQSELIPF